MAKDDIKKYMDDSPVNFHLFGCLFEIVFNKLELSKCKKRILNNYLGYSNKYEKLTQIEVGGKALIKCGINKNNTGYRHCIRRDKRAGEMR